MKQVKRMLWGVMFIVLGVILSLDAFDVVRMDLFFDGWWALFIIVPCTIGALTDYDKAWDIVGIVVGILLLLVSQDAFNAQLVGKLVVPVVLILVGLRLMWRGIFARGSQEAARRAMAAGKSLPEYSAVFSRQSRDFAGENFSGGEFTASFGRLDCDLTGATITDEAVIRANGIFGRVVLTLPADADVMVSSHGLFGGMTNGRTHGGTGTAGAIRIYVSGSCALGGVSLR